MNRFCMYSEVADCVFPFCSRSDGHARHEIVVRIVHVGSVERRRTH